MLSRCRDQRTTFVGRAGLLLVAAALTACSSLLGTDQAAFADEARILVEGTSTVPLRLLTSTRFIATRDSFTGDLVASEIVGDTLTLNLPFDRVFDIRGSDRFLARVANPDVNVTATVHVRIRLDNREVYNQRANMRDAWLQYIAYFRF